MGEVPEVRYADSDGSWLAYCVRGGGPIDVVRVPGNLSTILAGTVDPVLDAHYEQLAGFTRLVALDGRGQGMSDPFAAGGAPPLEQQVRDILAVMDAVGSRRAALYASTQGAPAAVLLAAMHPDRVSSLVLHQAFARWYQAPDYPHGFSVQSESEIREAALKSARRWGDLDAPFMLEWVAMSRIGDPSFRKVLARVQQVSASRATFAAQFPVVRSADVRSVLQLVQAPTLVLCATDLDHGASQYLVDRIPNARLAFYPGADTYFGLHTPEIGVLIEEFLTGMRRVASSDRVLASVLFTDLSRSTEQLAAVGDQKWRAYLDQHDAMVRTQLDRFRGREIKTTGDGFFATFDGPARAVSCAQAIIEGAHSLGIEIRAGVHVGECEARGDDLSGIAVHIAARVCGIARPGEVYTTSTVRDLVAGSGIEFADRGQHTLKGVPGNWTILAAVT
jgi:class 3 adenylate cyclase